MSRWALAAGLVIGCGGGAGAPDGAPAPADAGPTPGSYQDPFEPLDALTPGNTPETQEVRVLDDGRVLMCSGRRGLLVIDAVDPSNLMGVAEAHPSLGHAQTPRCFHLASAGSTVYVTSRGDEIQPTPFVTAFDLSQTPPVEGPSYQAAGMSFEGVATGAGFVYVAMHGAGLQVLEDTGAALAPRGVATGLSNAWGVAAAGSTVYVADGIGGLAIVDSADPDAPAVVGRAATGGAAQSVVIDGSIAWVACGASGLVAVDVSDPSDPIVVSTADTPGSAVQVAVAGGRAYVADWNDTRVFDISDPAAPTQVAVERIPTAAAFSRVLGIAAQGDIAFLGEWAGLHSYRFIPGRTAPDLSPWDSSITFGQVAPAASENFILVVENDGNEPLVITRVTTTGAGFSASGAMPQLLEPGGRGTIEVLFTPADTAEAGGLLTIQSDDPDEPARTIGLTGNRAGLGVGDTAPEIVVALHGGGEWRSSQHAGKVLILAYFATF